MSFLSFGRGTPFHQYSRRRTRMEATLLAISFRLMHLRLLVRSWRSNFLRTHDAKGIMRRARARALGKRRSSCRKDMQSWVTASQFSRPSRNPESWTGVRNFGKRQQTGCNSPGLAREWRDAACRMSMSRAEKCIRCQRIVCQR